MTNQVNLNNCVILADDNQPKYVQYAISELRDYLRELKGADVPLSSSFDDKADTVIVIGRELAEKAPGKPLNLDGLGDEGFIINIVKKSGSQFVVVAGATPQGTKFGIAHLMTIIHSDGKSAYIPQKLDIRSSPKFAKRGIHLNGWAFNYPYTFRCWREEDWRRYIDLQTLQGINLLYLWPFMEIMPVPLSREDESYLEEVRRLIEYAQVKHGMEVWIMQAVNRVATDDCGVRNPRHRPYWRPSQPDLNPGDPAQFVKIAESHEALYRILTNADGFCFIDCDPGGWKDSPPDELLKVLLNARKCLDRYSVNGKNTKLIHWLWGSWGHMFAPIEIRKKFMCDTLRLFKAKLPEPWELICGIVDYLPWCHDEGVLEKTIFLPYSVIEDEPSYPGTNLDLNRIRSAFDAVGKYPEIKGVMANTQTPFLQFPHLYYWNRLAWDSSHRDRTDDEILLETATHIYPAQAKLIAAGFKAFGKSSSDEINAIVKKLEKSILKGDFAGSSSFGRVLFPDNLIVAKSLLLQLRLRAAHEAFIEVPSDCADKKKCATIIENYIDAYLTWDKEHGWHGLWGYNPDRWVLGRLAEDPRFDSVLSYMHELFRGADLGALFNKISSKLSARHDSIYIAEAGIAPFKTFLDRGCREGK
jgi:hypothetical protein